MIHYQIQRKGEDALFTLSEGKKISHGLDSLVNYYMNEKQTGLQHSLTDWVPGNDWKCWCLFSHLSWASQIFEILGLRIGIGGDLRWKLALKSISRQPCSP